MLQLVDLMERETLKENCFLLSWFAACDSWEQLSYPGAGAGTSLPWAVSALGVWRSLLKVTEPEGPISEHSVNTTAKKPAPCLRFGHLALPC